MERYAVFYKNDDGNLVQYSAWKDLASTTYFYDTRGAGNIPLIILKDVTPNKVVV